MYLEEYNTLPRRHPEFYFSCNFEHLKKRVQNFDWSHTANGLVGLVLYSAECIGGNIASVPLPFPIVSVSNLHVPLQWKGRGRRS